ncbi:hypothetical protein [Myxacorys almedinensis]|nr:hypothetical protein [Myxacorys almedinensis]
MSPHLTLKVVCSSLQLRSPIATQLYNLNGVILNGVIHLLVS